MRTVALALAAALAGTSSAALAEPLSTANPKPLAALLADGYTIASTAPNGRAGEVVLILRKEATAFVCVLTEIRGEAYGEAKAKPAAQPCLPLN